MHSTDVAVAPVSDEAPAASQTPTARRFGTVAIALAVVVGLLLGVAGGLLIPRLSAPGDDSAEAGFARDMIQHHAQAVEMGLIVYRNSADEHVRQLGIDIALAQQGEIGTMQTWLRSWNLDPTGAEPPMAWMPDGRAMFGTGLMPGMATQEEMARLRAAQGTELDLLFIELMTKHHLGGIHMIDAVLELSDDDEVIQIATVSKRTQQTELTNLHNLRDKLSG
jgi:uncharacterized protein (DUF305 family)